MIRKTYWWCDRCRQQIEEDEHEHKPRYLLSVKADRGRYARNRESMALCQDCMNAIDRILRELPSTVATLAT